MAESVAEILELVDFRRRVAQLYADVRGTPDPAAGWEGWRGARDRLFREHPSSPYPPGTRSGAPPLPYFPYDPDWRLTAAIEPDGGERFAVGHSADGSTPARLVGKVRVTHDGRQAQLPVFWLEQYGGGLFLPFRDETSGGSTYGGGRYLLDTAKGADLGTTPAGELILDFNFAYHPSCVHDPRWSCPLAPPGSRLPFAVRAGERLTDG